jgi:hypothetical protein
LIEATRPKGREAMAKTGAASGSLMSISFPLRSAIVVFQGLAVMKREKFQTLLSACGRTALTHSNRRSSTGLLRGAFLAHSEAARVRRSSFCVQDMLPMKGKVIRAQAGIQKNVLFLFKTGMYIIRPASGIQALYFVCSVGAAKC